MTDAVSGVAQGGVIAVHELVDRVRGTKPTRRRAPSGPPNAKKVAERVRAEVVDAAERTASASRKAKRTGQRTVGRANQKAGTAARRAKRTATQAAGKAGAR